MESESKPQTSALEFEPQSFDFGVLSSGQETTTILKVRGGSGNISFSSDHFKVTPTNFTIEGSDIEITIFGGSSGELIWDEIILHTDAQEIKVPVTARWEVSGLERPVIEVAEAPVIQRAETKKHLEDKRTFKGRACSRCGKNFAYDINSMSWEECTCNWYQVICNISLRIFRDLRYGVKELPLYVQEIWQIIMGKEKW